MSYRTNIRKRTALALATAAAVTAVSATPALAASEPVDPTPRAPAGAEPRELPGVEAEIRELVPDRLAEVAGILGDPAIREILAAAGLEEALGVGSAIDRVTGGDEDDHPFDHWREKFGIGDDEPGAASVVSHDKVNTDPKSRFGTGSQEGDGRYNRLFPEGSGSRPDHGSGGPSIGGPPSAGGWIRGPRGIAANDGGDEGNGGDKQKDQARKDKEVVDSYLDSCGFQCNRYTEEHASGRVTVYESSRLSDGSFYYEVAEHDAAGRVVETEVEVENVDGENSVHYVAWPEDEQPLPPDGQGTASRGCWDPLPTSRRECGEPWSRESSQGKVSQPGRGPDGPQAEEPSPGFQASITERRDVVTQPHPDGEPVGGGGGGGSGGSDPTNPCPKAC